MKDKAERRDNAKGQSRMKDKAERRDNAKGSQE